MASSAKVTYDKLKKSFRSGKTRPIAWRLDQLKALKRCTFDNQDRMIEALRKDLRKPEAETVLSEIAMVFENINLSLENLQNWMKPTYAAKPSLVLYGLDTLKQVPEPYGTVLCIAPWNYPIQLSLVPLVGSIAAGNCMILKPSELAPHTGELLAEILPKYMDRECLSVITGGIPETQELLSFEFDYIFYTGSTAVGKIVMAAAAKFLTPVTLELGGKSPTIVDDTIDMYTACRRIAWGKLINSGQSCIAPDYILLHAKAEKSFISTYQKVVKEMVGDDAQKSDSYGRIINNRHWKRITALMENANIVFGGKTDEDDLYIEPTIIKATEKDPIMQEEIFGPVLPVIIINSIDEAIDFINDRPKPLACYIFSTNKQAIQKVETYTSSGAFMSNDTMMHAAISTLPFGGVGPSGIGSYHGKFSFESFSHYKPVVNKYSGLEFANTIRYAPYTKDKLNKIKSLSGYPTRADQMPGGSTKKLVIVAAGIALSFAIAYYAKSYFMG